MTGTPRGTLQGVVLLCCRFGGGIRSLGTRFFAINLASEKRHAQTDDNPQWNPDFRLVKAPLEEVVGEPQQG